MSSEKNRIIRKLQENGCRITKQRLELLDVILENRCSSCKEIYYQASKKDASVGLATVYRLVNALEKIGVLRRQIVYELSAEEELR
ncbi:MAG TPA: transcriptional repressor [Candidatus Eisenbergiella merdigallinarum]|uniref:Transcriptional repressor n=1 Tax=Candidatus Eisenbergiella merdigallinarum TaxID=2838552 RepID=A0A9D2MRK3_9FIRM|nr:transcriptional repressor [Candidatus Eisenbergiella merdigallinarum]